MALFVTTHKLKTFLGDITFQPLCVKNALQINELGN